MIYFDFYIHYYTCSIAKLDGNGSSHFASPDRNTLASAEGQLTIFSLVRFKRTLRRYRHSSAVDAEAASYILSALTWIHGCVGAAVRA